MKGRISALLLIVLGTFYFSGCYSRDTYYQKLIAPNGYLMVQVVTEDNKPIKDVTVYLSDPLVTSDESKKMIVVDKLKTNDEGVVYYGYLQAGKYVVRMEGTVDSKAFNVETEVQVVALERNYWIVYPNRYENIAPKP